MFRYEIIEDQAMLFERIYLSINNFILELNIHSLRDLEKKGSGQTAKESLNSQIL